MILRPQYCLLHPQHSTLFEVEVVINLVAMYTLCTVVCSEYLGVGTKGGHKHLSKTGCTAYTGCTTTTVVYRIQGVSKIQSLNCIEHTECSI